MFSSTILLLLALGITLSQAIPTLPKRATKDGARLTVYWGAEDDTTTLADVCADNSYDIVALAFLSEFFSDGGYPQLQLSTLNAPSSAQQAAGATGLQDGSSLVPAIMACQQAGKLVLLSLGGADGNITLTGDAQGEQIADTLWNLFLGGTKDKSLRPFDSLKLDGFDLGESARAS